MVGAAVDVLRGGIRGIDWTGRISLAEFLAGGNEGLPSFEGYKDLGRKSTVGIKAG